MWSELATNYGFVFEVAQQVSDLATASSTPERSAWNDLATNYGFALKVVQHGSALATAVLTVTIAVREKFLASPAGRTKGMLGAGALLVSLAFGFLAEVNLAYKLNDADKATSSEWPTQFYVYLPIQAVSLWLALAFLAALVLSKGTRRKSAHSSPR